MLVPQSWNTSNGISQRCSAKGELNFLSTLITEGSLQSLMWSSPTETLIAKGSSQSLVRSSTTRILSNYMTSFLVPNHERVRYRNRLSKAKMITIDDVISPIIASTICKNASILRMQKLKTVQLRNQKAHSALTNVQLGCQAPYKQISSQLSKTIASISMPIIKEVTAATHS